MASGKGLMQAKVCRGGAWVVSKRLGEAIMLLQNDIDTNNWLGAVRRLHVQSLYHNELGCRAMS